MTKISSPRATAHGRRKHRSGNFEQRLAFAGLDGDMPDDFREHRRRLGRMLAMYASERRGCPIR